MARYTAETLYNLLPSIYRFRDEGEQNGALRGLLAVLAGQAERIEDDIARLYDNSFIETCEPWAAAYIGELLGVHPLYPVTERTLDLRAQVANTLAYRRRKGAATMIEQLAHDATGWNARAVEFFALLSTSQNLNHPRPENPDTPDLRRGGDLELLGTAFNTIPHTVDVRHIASGRGRYNLPNVGLFLWRLQAWHLAQATAFAHGGGRFSFNPLGLDAPLYNLPRPETEITHLAEEINVPGALRRRALADELEALRQSIADRWAAGETGGAPPSGPYFGAQPAFAIFPDSAAEPVPPERILIADLSSCSMPASERQYTVASGARVSLPIDVVADPVLGRFAFTNRVGARARASFSYGFSAALGGGPYARTLPASAGELLHIPSAGIATLSDAFDAWLNAGRPEQTIQIDDNRTYAAGLKVELSGTGLVIRAAQGARPVLAGDLEFSAGQDTTALTLDGLVVAGRLILRGNIGKLTLAHSTLVPREAVAVDERLGMAAYASLVVDPPNEALVVTIDHCITGSLCVPSTVASLAVTDTIVDPPRRCALPALVSGSLHPFPTLSSASGRLMIGIAGEGPCAVALASPPATLAKAAAGLQQAIQKADKSPAFRQACVIVVGDRLAILPGVPGAVVCESAGEDATAAELRLIEPGSIQACALVGDPLPPAIELTGAPELDVKLPRGAAFAMSLDAGGTTPAKLSEKLDALFEKAFRKQGKHVWIGLADNRLVLIWDGAGIPFRLAGARKDYGAIRQLGLQSDWPAIAADDSGASPGPPARLERSTLLGTAHVRELELAADTVFVDRLHVERRQSGCVRFSYLAPGSYGPHAYDCCPGDAWPEFVAQRYGEPGYMQLAPACSAEIRTGAGNGAEMGAFNELLQPQREANLRGNLEEYLRFGLEAGIIFVN